jgi:hypothetical protein
MAGGRGCGEREQGFFPKRMPIRLPWRGSCHFEVVFFAEWGLRVMSSGDDAARAGGGSVVRWGQLVDWSGAGLEVVEEARFGYPCS